MNKLGLYLKKLHNHLEMLQLSHMNVTNIVGGLFSLVPGTKKALPYVKKIFREDQTRWGTSSASYCYEVWLKHLVMLWQNGMRSLPHKLAELGPGNSL
ncbi:hypothetical protein QUF90_23950 [Desulfococcaceae bacterium HSG9]|nr:hypothetical protein [Desulfococcaceae bacterium HSG9]